jgi:hypothetical protein
MRTCTTSRNKASSMEPRLNGTEKDFAAEINTFTQSGSQMQAAPQLCFEPARPAAGTVE